MTQKTFFILAFLYLVSVLFSQNFEGFESGNFYTYNWQFSGNADWIITAINPYEDPYCAQAGDIEDEEMTSLSISMETTYEGDISFYWKVSSQENSDVYKFYIDNTEIESISGMQEWELFSTSVQPGIHTFRWSYIKDPGGSDGMDTGWIDNITFPPTTTFDNDLSAKSISGPPAVYQGCSGVYYVCIKNYGNNDQENYTIKLIREGGEILDELNIAETIESEEEVFHSLVWIVPPDEPATITHIYAEVFLENDEDLSNNTTSNLQVNILEIGLMEIRVGYGTHKTNWYPFNFYFENNISETIYFPTEINHTGIIHAIAYYNDFTSYLPDKSVKIWMNMTAQSNLTSGWIPATSLNLVFNGMVDFPSGSNTIMIPLDSPFHYTGGNLVMMTYRVWENFTYSTDDQFNETITTIHYDRTRAVNSHSVIYPNNPPATSYVFSRFPNTSFFLELDGLGVIEGNVYDSGGVIIPSATITIEETQITTVSNGSAFYRFGNVFEGSYNLTASRYGYYPQSIPCNVIEDQTTVIDFSLEPVGTVEICGHVEGSDQPQTGLEGAVVFLYGVQDYDTVTDVNGDFIFPEVFENNDYDIQISKFGYESYSEQVAVGNINLDLGTIVLNEITFPPYNVTATQDIQGTEVEITWEAPSDYRMLESFNVYRFKEENQQNPYTWIIIATELEDTCFVDTLWEYISPDFYQFAVKSVYTNGIESEPAFSNILEKESGSGTPQDIQNLRTQIVGIFPNPFNPAVAGAGRSPATTISFQFSNDPGMHQGRQNQQNEQTQIEIYNLKGQKVKTFSNLQINKSPNQQILWNGTDENGKSQPSGIYFINLRIDGKSIDRKKCLLLK